MSSLILYLFIVSLSVHACSARCLGTVDKKLTKEYLLSEVEPQGNHQTGDDGKQSGEGLIWITGLPRNLLALLRREVGAAGNKVLVSSQIELQQVAKLERIEKRRRSLQSSRPDDAEEAVESGGSDAPEDVEVMDYAQPHRKPPIHNERS